MKWIRYTLDTTVLAEDYIAPLLLSYDITGMEIEDSVPITEEEAKGMFIDILPPLPEDKGEARLHFYRSEPTGEEGKREEAALLQSLMEDLKLLQERLSKELQMEKPLGELRLSIGETEDEDWINNWKQYFKPFFVGDWLIRPSWEEVPEDMEEKAAKVLTIDPGTAFGTGSHETTKLCLLGLREIVRPGDKVLDIGCGSGILSIAAAMLSADKVLGIDIDENAVRASIENLERNEASSLASSISFRSGNLLAEEEPEQITGKDYDVVVANILADIIIPLIPVVSPLLRNGGHFLASGILESRLPEVLQAAEADGRMEVVKQEKMKDWCSVLMRKNL